MERAVSSDRGMDWVLRDVGISLRREEKRVEGTGAGLEENFVVGPEGNLDSGFVVDPGERGCHANGTTGLGDGGGEDGLDVGVGDGNLDGTKVWVVG